MTQAASCTESVLGRQFGLTVQYARSTTTLYAIQPLS